MHQISQRGRWWSNPFYYIFVFGTLVLAFQNCGKNAQVSGGATNNSIINDLDDDLTITIEEIRVVAGENAEFVVRSNQPVTEDLEFSFMTEDGAALKGVHYLETAGSSFIPAGETTRVIEVPTIGNQTSDITDFDFYLVVSFADPNLNSGLQPGRATFGLPQSMLPVTDPAQNSSNAGQLSTGSSHTCAISALGVPYCWGRNVEGQLGVGNNGPATSPVMVAGMGLGGVSAISAGLNHTCAIRMGALFCWGANTQAELGDGTITNKNFPVPVQFLGQGVKAVSAGRYHTCAIAEVNGVNNLYCWGANALAQVGHNNGARQDVPYLVPNSAGVTAVAAGVNSTCMVKNGGLVCWGRNTEGQLGIGTIVNNNLRNPTTQDLQPILGLENGVTGIALNSITTCAIRNRGLYCWGYNFYNNLGDGLTASVPLPRAFADFNNGVIHGATGGDHSCVIRDGGVFCWGNNNHGELGIGNVVNAPMRPATPINITLNSGEIFVTIAAASGSLDGLANTHTCGRTNLGRVFCWGLNSQGQLGDGTLVNKSVPTLVNVP